ncbi:cytochrome c biogenesis heme-transporting ATPase CcmA [Pseudomonas viridiflava]|uniref:cytochrome c biogenesis heme-transporting ATPase CcmA n=1 Tax=Pseudomonas viridiflava TaxID=33069 RepID=UPI000F02A7D6|nr:cytochrome c biogenesis heme-transporting ATPase CcmA [Pseudomonas viridiflava]
MTAVTPLLHATALTCERDGRLLFENLDLALKAGDLLQVSGPNGSGKTSLLRMLCGLMQPTEGQVMLNGHALDRQRPQLTGLLLWIGHASGLKELLTPLENLSWLYALQGHGEPADFEQALETVGLSGFEDVPCHALSAGQQRRVALARLYLPGPPIWILDEPFTALDQQGISQLEACLTEHCARGGVVVLTTHHVLGLKPAGYRQLDLENRPA